MSYATREVSTFDGQPFEAYEFIGPVGTFRYTSLPFAVTLGGEVYEPFVVTRTAIVISGIVDQAQTMDFNIPATHVLCSAYAGRYTPDYLTVNAYRAHYGDDLSTEYTTEWQGSAVGFDVRDDWFIIQTVSVIQAKILGVTSTVYYQYSCNNRIYDSVCKAVKSEHQVTATVTFVDNVTIKVDAQSYPNGDLELGTLLLNRSNEERSIVSNIDGTITVAYPFLDIVVGDVVTLTQGCDNKMSTCVNRFDNILNFTGFRFIPEDDPMNKAV